MTIKNELSSLDSKTGGGPTSSDQGPPLGVLIVNVLGLVRVLQEKIKPRPPLWLHTIFSFRSCISNLSATSVPTLSCQTILCSFKSAAVLLACTLNMYSPNVLSKVSVKTLIFTII